LAGRQSSDKLKGGASLTFNGRNDHLELLIEAGINSIKHLIGSALNIGKSGVFLNKIIVKF